jgi:hypothetical protein
MNRIYRLGLVLFLGSALLAQTAPKTGTKKRPTAKAKSSAVTAADVQSLRDAIAAQQQQIESLKEEMQRRDAALQQSQQQAQQQLQQAQVEAADAKGKAAAVETAAAQQGESVAKLTTDLADVKTTLTNSAVTTQDDQKRMGALEGLLGRFRFTGDVRVRGESFFQNGVQDRNRARIRVRFGLEGKLNDDFLGGFALATGSLGDPTTTNTTFTNFFDRKTFGIDKGYITYNPLAHKWLTLTGGKHAYSWARTPQTFDNDLNPEGFGEKVSFNLNTPWVKNFTVGAMQILFAEVGGGKDSYAMGGYVSSKLQFGKFWTATPSFSVLKWNGEDVILQASAFATQATTGGATIPGTPPTAVPVNVPGEGPGCAGGSGLPSTPPCAFAPNGMTNATRLDANNRPHFLSGFTYADVILNNEFKTPSERLPLHLILEYGNNLDAASHPLDSTGAVLTSLGSQSHLYLAEISLGQAKAKNDFQFGYAWARQEQDSAIASFVESDQRAPTNILQHRIFGQWRIKNNVTAAYTLWIGRTLNTNLQHAARSAGVPVGGTDAWLKRMQFDLIYSF